MTGRLQSWHLLIWDLHQVAWEWTISQAQPWGMKKIDAFYPHTHISDLVDKFVEMCKWSKSLRKVVDCKAWTGLDSQVQIDHSTCIEVADSSYFFVEISLYLLIGDFFMNWRLIKDFKFDIVFSACFDYDIDSLSLYVFFMHRYVECSLPMFRTFTILHPKVLVRFILRLSKVSD